MQALERVCRGVVTAVLFHQKQLQLATGDADGRISIWDLVDKRRVAQLEVGLSILLT